MSHRCVSCCTAVEKLRIVTCGRSLTRPISLYTTVARTHLYTYAAKVRDLSIVQVPFSPTSRISSREQVSAASTRSHAAGGYSHRFNHTLQDNAQKMLDHMSPSLRGRLAYEIHSAWISKLEVFEGCPDLPQELFISIAVVLKDLVFASFEVLIAPHHKADCIFVINSGIAAQLFYFGGDSRLVA